ncbi:DUF7352 domain-containing protein [Rhodococcus pyridinivorans]|uniref:DUF7352 domain-containing protein n=1 Tax=Rhodococcus pyridinivorans TaxID=103816 RepID=A0A7M2XIT9_9NOCA|nr:hypothetical protein [Rhodococcus pyridinivorans]QOV97625.1 hypothetical protein INP59_17025 [Rhodococcus pyridinivorans]
MSLHHENQRAAAGGYPAQPARTGRAVGRTNIEITDTVTVELPARSRLLHVAPCRQNPDTHIDVWFEFPDQPTPMRVHTFHIEGTGHPLVDDALYVGTAVCPNGLVWHVYLDASTTSVQ